MVFPVVMCGCESWTVKKAEHRRIDAFVLFFFFLEKTLMRQLVDDRAGNEPRQFGSRAHTLKYNTIHTLKVKTGARDSGTC